MSALAAGGISDEAAARSVPTSSQATTEVPGSQVNSAAGGSQKTSASGGEGASVTPIITVQAAPDTTVQATPDRDTKEKSADVAVYGHGCSIVQAPQGPAFVVCQPAVDPVWIKLMPVVPTSLSLVVSGFALYMAWRTFNYNQQKDAKARAQSIQDDFWIRKVVSPASVEPFLKLVVEMRQTLPSALDKSASRVEEVKKFWAKEAKSLNELSSGFHSLELIDSVLHSKVEEVLLELEDVLSNYIGGVLEFIDSDEGKHPDRAEAVKAMNERMLCVFRHIQEHQQSLGFSDKSATKPSWFTKLFSRNSATAASSNG